MVRGPLTVEQQVAVWELSRKGWPFSRVARHLGRSRRRFVSTCARPVVSVRRRAIGRSGAANSVDAVAPQRRCAGIALPCPAIRVTGKQSVAITVDAPVEPSLASDEGNGEGV